RVPSSRARAASLRPARAAQPRGAARHPHGAAGDDAARALSPDRRAAAAPRAVRWRVRGLQPHRALAPRRRPERRAPLRPASGLDGGGAATPLARDARRPGQHHLCRPFERHRAGVVALRGVHPALPPPRRPLAGARAGARMAPAVAHGRGVRGVRPPASRVRRDGRRLRAPLGRRAPPLPALGFTSASGLRRRGGAPRFPRRVSTPPFYLPIGDEVAVFTAAWSARLPVLLKGPTGCGKTRFIEYMAATLPRSTSAGRDSWPLITVACHEDLTGSDLVGRYLIKGDETVWIDGPLTRAVRHGAICYLDEVVEARKDTVVLIHPLTDHRRLLPID